MSNRSSDEMIISMLFSDLKGYSNLRNDRLKDGVIQFLQDDIIPRSLTQKTKVVNTWGDALFICSLSPSPLAEAALKLRDAVRNTDWIGMGLPNDLAIRIALHVHKAIVHYDADGQIKNAVGVGVDTTARIEPITEPNTVYCSARLYDFLQDAGLGKIRGISLGRRMLAKNFGEMDLFQLLWNYEIPVPASVTTQSIKPAPMPAIKRKFGDKQRSEFLNESFQQILAYFANALDQLRTSNPEIEFTLKPLGDNKFVCDLYFGGKLKTRCKVWVSSQFGNEQINYLEGRSAIENDNAFNEAVRVLDDGIQMYLKSSFGTMYSHLGGDTANTPSTPEQIAENLWLRFTWILNAH